jgi:hypothetical protein
MGTLETPTTALGAAGEGVDSHRASFSVTWLALAGLGAATALVAQIGADARWLAALGAHIASTWTIPDGLPYAAASSAGWQNVPVIGELVFHALNAALAERGLIVAQVAAVMIALGVIARDMRAAGATDKSGGVVLVVTALAAAPALLIVRAQLFSIAVFPVLLLLLRADARRPSRRIWLVVPLLAAWANLHGGVLVGAVLTCVYLLLHRVRHGWKTSFGVLGACLLSLVATPALLGTVAYYQAVLTGEAAARASGLWAPLSLHAPFDVLFLIAAIPLCALAIRARPPLWELAALAGLGVMAVNANRNTVWFALFVAVPAARAFNVGVGKARASDRLNIALAFVLAVAAVAVLTRTPVQTAAGTRLLQATEAAAAGQPVLADPLNAEELALEGQRIWIGNPLDAFERGEQRLYLDWLEGLPRGDRELTHRACAVLVTLGGEPQQRLARNPAYRELDRDSEAVLYRRSTCSSRS